MGGVNLWKQSGQVFFWRYLENVRNYPGWHLVVDAAGRQSLVDLFEAMVVEHAPTTRTIHVTTPTTAVLSIPANRRSGVHHPEKIRLTFDPRDKEAWSLAEQASEAALVFGDSAATVLLGGLREPVRVFDTIFLKDPDLWFWGIAPPVSHSPA